MYMMSYSYILAGFFLSLTTFCCMIFCSISSLYQLGFLSLLPFARFDFLSCIVLYNVAGFWGLRSLTFCLAGFSRSASVFGPSKSNTCMSTSFFTILPSANFSLDRASPKVEFRHQSCYHLLQTESQYRLTLDHYAYLIYLIISNPLPVSHRHKLTDGRPTQWTFLVLMNNSCSILIDSFTLSWRKSHQLY